jgi:hypothetical protein
VDSVLQHYSKRYADTHVPYFTFKFAKKEKHSLTFSHTPPPLHTHTHPIPLSSPGSKRLEAVMDWLFKGLRPDATTQPAGQPEHMKKRPKVHVDTSPHIKETGSGGIHGGSGGGAGCRCVRGSKDSRSLSSMLLVPYLSRGLAAHCPRQFAASGECQRECHSSNLFQAR